MRIRLSILGHAVFLLALCAALAQAQGVFTKAQVAERIRKVENGVDEFRDYLERRGKDAKDRADSAQSGNRTRRRGTNNSSANDTGKERAKDKKDDLDDALGDLNRSTNRLRRRFDPTDTWLETKVQMERVMEDARRVNQIMVRGNYGTQAERYWAVLRAAINDLARCYGLAPMAA